MKETIKLGFILSLICAVAAGALALTDKLTFQARLDARIKAEQDALKVVHPFAEKFEETSLELPSKPEISVLFEELGITSKNSGNETGKFKVFNAIDKDDKILGIAFQIQPKGFSGPVKMMVGILNNIKVSGIKVLSHQETPGLGAKIEEISSITANKLAKESKTPDMPWIKALQEGKTPWFLAQFYGRSFKELELDKDNSKIDDPVDSITASTISSRAVTKGIRNALRLYEVITAKEEK
jgi:electron transport complex protein RnfG